MPRPTSRRSSRGCRWRAAPSGNACRRSPRPRCWPGAASGHPGQQRGGRRRASSPGLPRWPASPGWRSAPTMPAQVDALESGRRQAGVRLTRAGRDRCRRGPLRRRAGPGGGRSGAADRRLPASRASAACRPTMAAPSTSARRRSARASIAAAARRRAPPVEQLRQHGLDCPIVGGAGTGTFALEAAAASSPSCRSAPTSSWMPTMAATRRRRPSATRCSCWRPS